MSSIEAMDTRRLYGLYVRATCFLNCQSPLICRRTFTIRIPRSFPTSISYGVDITAMPQPMIKAAVNTNCLLCHPVSLQVAPSRRTCIHGPVIKPPATADLEGCRPFAPGRSASPTMSTPTPQYFHDQALGLLYHDHVISILRKP